MSTDPLAFPVVGLAHPGVAQQHPAALCSAGAPRDGDWHGWNVLSALKAVIGEAIPRPEH